ncbi:MAG: nitrile hydratase accessory protein [Gloeocapsa sp. UFS-A4-WI-NPMV-4B04]|jgi:nitrile hydratase accessory protein|nr:nitrile hydratase accessory protein [Gloeocapsa sp. UFS-A4-WI-NPMV-4B04]
MNDSPQSSFELAVDQNEIVFQAPWQAHAFALVNQLAAAHYCTWSEWTNYLVNEISAAEQEAPGTNAYCKQWVYACEKLLIEKQLLEPEAIQRRLTELISAQEINQHQHG